MGLVKFVMNAIDIFGYVPQNCGASKFMKNVDRELDISYSNIHEDCKLDVYYPKNYDKTKQNPAILFIHGGGFIAGDKKCRKKQSAFLANQGFVVINANYPLCPKLLFPDQIPVFIELVKWCGEASKKYAFNPMDMVMSGDSAGGHCSNVILGLENSEEYRKKFNVEFPKSVHFSHALMLSGCFDLKKTLLEKQTLNANVETARLVTGMKDIRSQKDIKKLDSYPYLEQLNTVRYVNKDYPKMFISHVHNDAFCFEQGIFLREALNKNNVPYTEYYAKRKLDIHDNTLFFYKKSAKEANAAMCEWLNKEYISYFK